MPQLEIEYKYRITQDEQKQLIDSLIKKIENHSKIYKSDVYYRLDREQEVPLNVRIRHSGIIDNGYSNEKSYLTYKIKGVTGNDATPEAVALKGGEFNKEFETEIADAEPLVQLLSTLGFYEYVRKEKSGMVFIMPLSFEDDNASEMLEKGLAMCIEVVEVKRLGYFCEIEVVTKEDISNKHIAYLQGIIKDFASSVGLNDEMLETRFYMDMLPKVKTSASG